MANKQQKPPQNVPGAYYVDDSCIDCDLCRNTAPTFFQRFEEGGYTVVVRQPQTPEELALADDALTGCPTESIGNDGVE